MLLPSKLVLVPGSWSLLVKYTAIYSLKGHLSSLLQHMNGLRCQFRGKKEFDLIIGADKQDFSTTFESFSDWKFSLNISIQRQLQLSETSTG